MLPLYFHITLKRLKVKKKTDLAAASVLAAERVERNVKGEREVFHKKKNVWVLSCLVNNHNRHRTLVAHCSSGVAWTRISDRQHTNLKLLTIILQIPDTKSPIP